MSLPLDECEMQFSAPWMKSELFPNKTDKRKKRLVERTCLNLFVFYFFYCDHCCCVVLLLCCCCFSAFLYFVENFFFDLNSNDATVTC